MSLLSALQPNKWTWQICYEDTKPASDHYAVTKRLHFGGNHKLFGAASFASRECASNPHVSAGSCTMTCARCSWQWPPIPNAAARSYAAQLFKAFQCATWNLQRSCATISRNTGTGSQHLIFKSQQFFCGLCSPKRNQVLTSSSTNNKSARRRGHLQLQNTIKRRPISAQTGITIIQTCHAECWWASHNSVPNVLSCIDPMALQQLGTITPDLEKTWPFPVAINVVRFWTTCFWSGKSM